jgi:hypothetical protein
MRDPEIAPETWVTRREVIEKALRSGVLCLGFPVSGVTLVLTPAQARTQQVTLRTLSAGQVKTLEVFAEALVPGSINAGVIHFIDHQITADPADCLLIAKYLQAPLPYRDFYAAGLRSLDSMAQQMAGKSLASLDEPTLEKLVTQASLPTATVDGFPVQLFYMCVRSDAVDVVYGTPEGFQRLNVPYMQHILPPESWDG